MDEMIRVSEDGAARARAALERCVCDGGVVLFPADTVYGLACDPESAGALERIHRLKVRDPKRPSAVMFFDDAALDTLVSDLGARVRRAVRSLLPGPVTLVVPNPRHLFPQACGPDRSRLGVRLIDGPLAGVPVPVLQTSANPSGGQDARTIEELPADIRDGVDVVIDGGELPGTASTVIDISGLDADGEWSMLREGAVPRAEVARVIEATGER